MKFNLSHIFPNKLWIDTESRQAKPKARRKVKTHLYHQALLGQEFVIEPLNENLKLYVMTSQRAGLKAGDRILIKDEAGAQAYEILEIEYYCGGPTDMWIAKLAARDV